MKKRFFCLLFAGIILFCGSVNVFALSDTEYDYTLDVSSGKRVAISKCYSAEKITTGYNGKSFGTVSDIFVDDSDFIYLISKNDNCIVKLNPNGEFVRGYFRGGHGQ